MKLRPMFLSAALLSAMFASAKDHVLVIRGADTGHGNKTVVTDGGHTPTSDTLTVRPAVDASIIIVALKDPDGTILDERQCAATWNDQVTIIAPAALPHGYFLEVRDDKGFLYREFNQ